MSIKSDPNFIRLKKELRELHGLQWTKVQTLRRFVRIQADLQRRMHKNSVVMDEASGHGGARYIPEYAATDFRKVSRAISRLAKDIEARRKIISMRESEIEYAKNTVVMNAYFETSTGVVGIHAVCFKCPDGTMIQEEIWGNNYRRNTDGKLEMAGGSFRVFNTFEATVKDLESDPELKRISDDQEVAR